MDKPVDRIRSFNQFYTNKLGVLNKHILDSHFSLSEVRVLYELSTNPDCSARTIMQILNVDEGYLSRIIDRLTKSGLVERQRSDSDKRKSMLKLTTKGQSTFRKLNQASSKAIEQMISGISKKELEMMLLMMEGIQNILTKT
jgi:DNA-binding MarR family transcriptional regulator